MYSTVYCIDEWNDALSNASIIIRRVNARISEELREFKPIIMDGDKKKYNTKGLKSVIQSSNLIYKQVLTAEFET